MGRGLNLKESEIEMAMGHYLNHEARVCFYKQNVRGFFKDGRFRKDRNPYALSGLPDYVVLYKGFHLGLEVKAKNGKQTENQIEFETYIRIKGGALYHVVRSVEEAKKIVEAFKADVDKFCLVANREGCFKGVSVTT